MTARTDPNGTLMFRTTEKSAQQTMQKSWAEATLAFSCAFVQAMAKHPCYTARDYHFKMRLRPPENDEWEAMLDLWTDVQGPEVDWVQWGVAILDADVDNEWYFWSAGLGEKEQRLSKAERKARANAFFYEQVGCRCVLARVSFEVLH